jgi:membrane protein
MASPATNSVQPPGTLRSRAQPRPRIVDLWWILRDYAKRVWDNSGEDNVLFMAGGIAFNIMLAAFPFILLLAAGAAWLLPFVAGTQGVDSDRAIYEFIDRLLPEHAHSPTSQIDTILLGLLRLRGTVTFYGAIGFVWFSTRLFGSLRTVLASVFDIEEERGIIAGKIFDVKITIVATLLFVANVTVSSYLALATHSGARVLVTLGLRRDVMGRVDYSIGRLFAFFFIGLMFFALYKYLPVRRVRAKSAFVAAAFTSVAFEAARIVFSYVTSFNPASLYGALAAVVIMVIWFYYAALIFILGGEVGQVYELRRVRKLQREVFTDY